MDGLQIGDLAFNEATNKKKKQFLLPRKAYVYVGMTFHALSLTPEFAACFRCKKQCILLSCL